MPRFGGLVSVRQQGSEQEWLCIVTAGVHSCLAGHLGQLHSCVLSCHFWLFTCRGEPAKYTHSKFWASAESPSSSSPYLPCWTAENLQQRTTRIGRRIWFQGLLLTSCWQLWGFPGSSAGKESLCNAGDVDLVPGSGKSFRAGNSKPLQYSSLENSMGRGAWWAAVYGVAQSQTRLKWLSSIQGYCYHLSKFHIYALVYCIGVFLSGLLHSV